MLPRRVDSVAGLHADNWNVEMSNIRGFYGEEEEVTTHEYMRVEKQASPQINVGSPLVMGQRLSLGP